jgi:predicted nucleic acid-binding protein
LILADSSVWIDYLRDQPTWQAQRLDGLFDSNELVMGDLVLLEVLQGYSTEREAARVERLLERLEVIQIGGRDIALRAAKHYRALRRAGITVRSTIDTLIATRCIADGLTLLHSDRDFLPFERELGLSVVTQATH